ncbi:hypothetical protein [Streptomyces sp. AF1A]|uniref:hypothetical protein n=1 Tax=Streptomyces sp. AF1A TaxID=3394350 RepID=UPI0039BC81EC
MHTQTRTRALRFTAVLAFVVLNLTGFSTGRHHHSRHRTGGGGGCSSSHQDHDSYHRSYGDDHHDSGTSGGTGGYGRRPTHRVTSTPSSSGTALRDGTAKLVRCATEKAPYATVEVTNPNGRQARFTVDVEFDDSKNTLVAENSATVTVPAKGTARVRVELLRGTDFADDGLVHQVGHCRVGPRALLAG